MKPYSESCDQNREPILAVLGSLLASPQKVLEIGSGTGQHAVFLGAHLPHLEWLTSDLPDQHPGILAWLEEAGLPNVQPPIELDVKSDNWPAIEVDAVFSANTVHILDVPGVEHLFRGVGRVLAPGGLFVLYGPFNYDGGYTSDSNARFDDWLKARDPASGIKDRIWLESLAADVGMALAQDIEMPVNNRILVWKSPDSA